MDKTIITFGETMMRLTTPGNGRIGQGSSFDVVFGGSESNVSSSLAIFGKRSSHVTVFPDNDLGKAAISEFRKLGVETKNIYAKEGRMGLYFLEQGSAQRPSRIVYDRFHSAFAEIQPGTFDWDEIMQEATWFHYSGITPAISEGAYHECLSAVKAAEKHGVTVSGDINYRRNLWQYGKGPGELMPSLIEKTNMIVAGLEDFKNCMGIVESDFQVACEKAVKMFPSIQKVATTFRDTVNASHNTISGTLWAENVLLNSRKHEVYPIVDRVGAGDAFMAGLIYGWTTGMSDQETIEFSVAANVLKHSIEGDVNRSTVEEIKALSSGESTGRLMR